ncbi:AAA_16 domain-containing protein, partial [Haematococcus lacustris]
MPQVYFSAYRPTELQEILMQVMSEMGVQPGSLEEQVWPHFVSGVVCDQFVQLSRHACDLKALAITLWPPYIRPLQESPELADAPLESIVRQLMGRAKRHLLPPCLAVRAQHEADWGGLPVTAKLLLVAAFIASHNKPTLDKAVFDVRAKSGRSRCKHADLQSDRQIH